MWNFFQFFKSILAPWVFVHVVPSVLKVFVNWSCLTLCNSVDGSPPGPSVHGISQARILEWVAIPFARRSSQPRDQTQVSWVAGRFDTIWATGKRSLEPFNSSPNRLPEYQPFRFLFKDALSARASLVVPIVLPHIFLHHAHVIMLFRLNGNSGDT